MNASIFVLVFVLKNMNVESVNRFRSLVSELKQSFVIEGMNWNMLLKFISVAISLFMWCPSIKSIQLPAKQSRFSYFPLVRFDKFESQMQHTANKLNDGLIFI